MIWRVQFREIFGWLPQCLRLNRFRRRRHHLSASLGCLSSLRERLACESEAQQNAHTAYLLSSLEDAEFQVLLLELRYPPIRYSLHKNPQRPRIRVSSPDAAAQSIHHDPSANREDGEAWTASDERRRGTGATDEPQETSSANRSLRWAIHSSTGYSAKFE
jgi:hypothetical protein